LPAGLQVTIDIQGVVAAQKGSLNLARRSTD
jgi:hypothetical protein